MQWNEVYILTGSNIGERSSALAEAANLLERRAGIIIKASQVYQSPAWGITEQNDFLNQVINLRCVSTPSELLKLCLNIEKDIGRVRHEKWGPRLIDIDILYYNDEVLQQEGLSIPHPGIPERIFTLKPLVEIAPKLLHPALNKTQEELLSAHSKEEQNEVRIYSN